MENRDDDHDDCFFFFKLEIIRGLRLLLLDNPILYKYIKKDIELII